MKLDPNSISQARETALRILTYREHSITELKRKLQRKGYNEEILQILLNRLEEVNLLNNTRFAQLWIENRKRKGTYGRKRIIQELKQKGISISIINKLLETEFDYETELELAIKQAQKKLNIIKKREHNKLKQHSKLYNFLIRRGFDGEIVSKVINIVNS